MRAHLRSMHVAVLVVLSVSACVRQTPDDVDLEVATVVADVKAPMVVSHRGGASVFPEETMVGFEESAADGYFPEMDIQFLRGGEPVLVHDDTADRTMTGVSGPIEDITLDEWTEAKVKSPTGAQAEPAVTLAEVLDELGGEIVLVPEIKAGASPAQVDQVLDMIRDRGLTDSVIVQSFDYDTSRRVADAGMASLFLTGDDPADVTPEGLLADGIEWFGPSRDMPAEDMERFSDGGVKVAPYTLPTRSEGEALDADVFGYFTDDPWSWGSRHPVAGAICFAHDDPRNAGPAAACPPGAARRLVPGHERPATLVRRPAVDPVHTTGRTGRTVAGPRAYRTGDGGDARCETQGGVHPPADPA